MTELTEQQIQEMKDTHELKIRVEDLIKSVANLQLSFNAHSEKEEAKIEAIRNEMHETFVKKKELKIYGGIIMAVLFALSWLDTQIQESGIKEITGVVQKQKSITGDEIRALIIEELRRDNSKPWPTP